jgi:hypothetical protein
MEIRASFCGYVERETKTIAPRTVLKDSTLYHCVYDHVHTHYCIYYVLKINEIQCMMRTYIYIQMYMQCTYMTSMMVYKMSVLAYRRPIIPQYFGFCRNL